MAIQQGCPPFPSGQRILNALDRTQQTQDWLALQVNVSPSYISKIIHGCKTNPSLRVAQKIEEVLNEKIW